MTKWEWDHFRLLDRAEKRAKAGNCKGASEDLRAAYRLLGKLVPEVGPGRQHVSITYRERMQREFNKSADRVEARCERGDING